MVNKWYGIGNLGRDPETKQFSGGSSVTNFSLACEEKWTDKATGEKKSKTDWINCQAWGKLGEICAQYLKKGQQIFVSGRLSVRSYEKDGEKKYITEIILSEMKMLGGKQESQQTQQQSTKTQQQQAEPEAQKTGDSVPEDDIPF